MKARLAIFFLCFLLPFSGSSFPLFPSNLHFEELDNGLTIMVLEDPEKQNVTIKLCIKGGAITEPPRFDGFSHLYEHLFFKLGNENAETQSFRKKVQANGGSFQDTTGLEHASYTMTLPHGMVNKGFSFLNKLVRDPEYDLKKVKRAKRIIEAEYQKSQSYPLFLLNQDMIDRLWAPFVSRKNRFGNWEAIALATPDMLDTFRRANFRPRQTLLAVTGNVNPDDVFDKAYRVFDDWPKEEGSKYEKYERPNFPRLTNSSQIVTETESASQPVYKISLHGPGTDYDKRNTYPAKVFANILDQRGSKLQTSLVDSGLATNVTVRYHPLKYKSTFSITVEPDSGKLQQAHRALLKEMEKWKKDSYYTDEQLAGAKERIENERTQMKASTDQYLSHIASRWASSGIGHFLHFTDSCLAVDREEINIFVEKYLANRAYVAGLVIDSATRDRQEVDSFFTTTPNIQDLSFRYKTNSAQLKTKKDSQQLLGLIQWMEINPEPHIQVNGLADKSEYLKIRDKQYLTYMDTLKGFEVPHRLNIGRMSVRLDILRSLKIVKSLTDADINPGRIAGSGRLQEGETKEEVRDNQKATVRLK